MKGRTPPYGPKRGLKKPRGKRAKATIRMRARALSSLTPGPSSKTSLRRLARWKLAKLGASRDCLRRIDSDPATGRVVLVFRRTTEATCREATACVEGFVPVTIVLKWELLP